MLELENKNFAANLQPGWNLLMVPEEMQAPEDAVVIFSIGKSCCELHRQNTLAPGKIYWVFRSLDSLSAIYP